MKKKTSWAIFRFRPLGNLMKLCNAIKTIMWIRLSKYIHVWNSVKALLSNVLITVPALRNFVIIILQIIRYIYWRRYDYALKTPTVYNITHHIWSFTVIIIMYNCFYLDIFHDLCCLKNCQTYLATALTCPLNVWNLIFKENKMGKFNNDEDMNFRFWWHFVAFGRTVCQTMVCRRKW